MGQYEGYSTGDPSDGNLAITAVDGKTVKGNFSLKIPKDHGQSGFFVLENGSFQFDIADIEK